VTPRAATFSIFAINGAMVGTWVAHIPWLQDQLGISRGTLGLCLLCMAAGAFVSMPLTGHILDRRPSASVTRVSTLVFCLLLPLPLLATSAPMLAASLFVFGAASGVMDVSMNAHGIAVQQSLSKPIMSSLHGGWSLGGFASAGLVAVTAASGVDPRLESLIVGLLLLMIGLWVTRRLGSASAHSEVGHRVVRPSRAVIAIGGMCFLAMLTEGAIGDWSGIYLRHVTGASAAAAAMAFTGFSLGMATARLTGDVLTERFGAARLVRAGMALVALALGTVLLLGATLPAVVGFALCGLGIANAVPLLFSAAGRLDPPGPSLAASFTLGYLGFIIGPPLIGILSDQIGLPETLSLLLVSALAVSALAGRGIGSGSRGSLPPRGLASGVEKVESAVI
jgi:predicted MFS family arabinose efflux permease